MEQTNSELNKVGGWLLLLVVLISITAVFRIIVGALQLMTNDLSSTNGTFGLVNVALGVFGGFCVRGLYERRPTAPMSAHLYMGAAAALALFTAVAFDSFTGAGAPLLFWAVWGIYLKRSRRVAIVYQTKPNEEEDVEFPDQP